MNPEVRGPLLVFAALGVISWTCAALTYRTGFRPFGPQRNRAVPWGGAEIALLLIAFATQLVGAVWQLWAGSSDKAPPEFTAAFEKIGATLLAVSLMIELSLPVILVTVRGARLYQMGMHCSHFTRNVLVGIGAYFLAFPPVSITFLGAQELFERREHVLEQLIRESPTLDRIVVSTLLAVVVAPLFEELLFRGILLPWLRRVLGVWPAIVTSSLLFAVLHADAWPAPIPLFVLALFLGYLAYRTSSLVAPIVLHATFNGVSMLALVLQVKFSSHL